MTVDNPDHPWAAGPPVTLDEDDVTLPSALWSAVLREMDPHPVSGVMNQIQWRLQLIAAELDKFDEVPPGREMDWLVELQQMVTHATRETQPKPVLGCEDVPRELLDAVIAYLKENHEPPDTSVGIWGNGWGELAYELALAREGKLTCRDCSEGFTWDEGVFLEKTAEIAAKTGEDLDELRRDGQDYGNVICPKCSGTTVVRMEEQ
jgi:hypothetical protein